MEGKQQVKDSFLLGIIHGLMKMSLLTRLLWSAFFLLVFLLAFLFPVVQFQGAEVILITLPALATALFFGVWVGLLSLGLFHLALMPALLHFFRGQNFFESFEMGLVIDFGMGLVVVTLMGFLNFLVKRIHNMDQKLKKLSTQDHLTGLLNRRAFLDRGGRFFSFFKRQKGDINFFKSTSQPSKESKDFKSNRELGDYAGALSLAILDMDYFKKINDRYGHTTGDEMLKSFAEILKPKEILRLTDVVGRYAGEEFIIVFPGTSARNASIAMEKVHQALSRIKFEVNGSEKKLTFSCGITEMKAKDGSLDDLVTRAYKALSNAKEEGRNRTVILK